MFQDLPSSPLTPMQAKLQRLQAMRKLPPAVGRVVRCFKVLGRVPHVRLKLMDGAVRVFPPFLSCLRIRMNCCNARVAKTTRPALTDPIFHSSSSVEPLTWPPSQSHEVQATSAAFCKDAASWGDNRRLKCDFQLRMRSPRTY